MFRLAHFSDLHLGPLPAMTWRQLVSKRLTGFVNWHVGRRKLHQDDVPARFLEALAAAAPSHIAMTGDLINLGHESEIEIARTWLETLGSPDFVSVVPGNHDAYVPGALARALKEWGPFMHGDEPNASSTPFPYLRIREHIALIGLSSARATAPFMATGYFRKPQARELDRMLHETRERGLYRVVMIHHPPLPGDSYRRRLVGGRLFREIVHQRGAELVLHGHTHLPTLNWIQGPEHPVPVVGVAAAGQAAGGAKPAAQFNLFEIEGNPGRWRTGLTRLAVAEAQTSALETAELYPV